MYKEYELNCITLQFARVIPALWLTGLGQIILFIKLDAKEVDNWRLLVAFDSNASPLHNIIDMYHRHVSNKLWCGYVQWSDTTTCLCTSFKYILGIFPVGCNKYLYNVIIHLCTLAAWATELQFFWERIGKQKSLLIRKVRFTVFILMILMQARA